MESLTDGERRRTVTGPCPRCRCPVLLSYRLCMHRRPHFHEGGIYCLDCGKQMDLEWLMRLPNDQPKMAVFERTCEHCGARFKYPGGFE